MNAYSRITLYRENAEIFIRRTISTLERINFTDNYDKEVQHYKRSLLDAGCDGYTAAEETIYRAGDLAGEYALLNDGMYAAVITGFYHLWERDIRDLCKRLLRYYSVIPEKKIITEQMLQSFKYKDLKAFLIAFKVDNLVFDEINLLRIIVNTIKHTEGNSSRELFKTHKPYYYKLANLCDLGIDDDANESEITIMAEGLGIEDLKYFGDILNRFWANIDKYQRFREMHF